VAKLFRVIRLMRLFRELRLIWDSILGSVRAIFWAMLLLAVCMFLVGLCIVQASGSHLVRDKEHMTDEEIETIFLYWSSVRRSMITLFMSITNGLDWERLGGSLEAIGAGYYALFVFFIFFYTCVVTNTLTSLFVETSMMNADKDEASRIEAQMEEMNNYITKLRHWFSSLDTNGNESLSYEEFLAGTLDPRAVAFASTLGVQIMDLKEFFRVLSDGGRREVNVEQFVLGCIKMRGAAKRMDLVALTTLEREFHDESRERHAQFEAYCKAQFEALRRPQQ